MTSAKIATNAVTSAKIAEHSVNVDEIAPRAVDTTAIAQYTIATDNIANSAITSALIADGAIQTSKIVDNSVTSAKIAASTITNSEIVAGLSLVDRNFYSVNDTATYSAWIGQNLTVIDDANTDIRTVVVPAYHYAYVTLGGGGVACGSYASADHLGMNVGIAWSTTSSDITSGVSSQMSLQIAAVSASQDGYIVPIGGFMHSFDNSSGSSSVTYYVAMAAVGHGSSASDPNKLVHKFSAEGGGRFINVDIMKT